MPIYSLDLPLKLSWGRLGRTAATNSLTEVASVTSNLSAFSFPDGIAPRRATLQGAVRLWSSSACSAGAAENRFCASGKEGLVGCYDDDSLEPKVFEATALLDLARGR